MHADADGVDPLSMSGLVPIADEPLDARRRERFVAVCLQAASFPAALPTCVAIASINGGDRQS